jgi:hypothetical protein
LLAIAQPMPDQSLDPSDVDQPVLPSSFCSIGAPFA